MSDLDREQREQMRQLATMCLSSSSANVTWEKATTCTLAAHVLALLDALAAAYRALDARTLTEEERGWIQVLRETNTHPAQSHVLAIIDRVTGRTFAARGTTTD